MTLFARSLGPEPRLVVLCATLCLALFVWSAAPVAATEAPPPAAPVAAPVAATEAPPTGAPVPAVPAVPAVHVIVDVSDQRMTVLRDGVAHHDWPVSTARKGKWTPRGTFRPQTLARRHYSSLYNNAPMPWSIFFRGNYAIHGTDQVRKLGRPASAGCIRLSPENARTLFEAVKAAGKANVRIEIRD